VGGGWWVVGGVWPVGAWGAWEEEKEEEKEEEEEEVLVDC